MELIIIQHQLREEDLPQNKDKDRVDTTVVHFIHQEEVHSTEVDHRTDVVVVIDVVIHRAVDNLNRILVSIHYKKVGGMVVIDVVSFIVLEFWLGIRLIWFIEVGLMLSVNCAVLDWVGASVKCDDELE